MDGRWQGEPYASSGATRPSLTLGRYFHVTGDPRRRWTQEVEHAGAQVFSAPMSGSLVALLLDPGQAVATGGAQLLAFEAAG